MTKLGVAGLLLLSVIELGTGQVISFPGQMATAKSPDGRFLIRNEDRDSEPFHILFIEANEGKPIAFKEYARHVDVLWGPTSDYFAVNDWKGSDRASPFLYAVSSPETPIDLELELVKTLKHSADGQLFGNHHVYLSVLRWTGSKQMVCRLSGHGDKNPRSFTKYYTYTVGKGFSVHKPKKP